ncbi:hypothetical protein [Methanosphaerula palustris]|uniref:hypothetical protein n=1 Tax=Methanosphaerula palustris TaxID=475088 RepID=UPI0001848B32|nr:hypothetical protein [Methanosphaerula palustris]
MDWGVKTRLISCITKAEDKLEYSPHIKFGNGLKETHKWFAENWDAIEMGVEFP